MSVMSYWELYAVVLVTLIAIVLWRA